jgi:hypothetical protein
MRNANHLTIAFLAGTLAIGCSTRPKNNETAAGPAVAAAKPLTVTANSQAAPGASASPASGSSTASAVKAQALAEDPLDGVWQLERFECIGVKIPADLKNWNARLRLGQYKQIFRKSEQRVTVDIKKTASLKNPGTYCRGFRYEEWQLQGKEKILVSNATSYERGVGGDPCWSSNKDPETREYSYVKTKTGFKFNLWKNALCAGRPTILVYKKLL